MSGRELGAYLVCCAVWGSTWLVIRYGLADLPPFLFAGTRMLLACALLIPLALRDKPNQTSRADWVQVAFVGAINIAIPYGLIFYSQQYIPSGIAALLFGTFPIWVALYSHWLLPAEPLTVRRAVAALLGVGGVATLYLPVLFGVSFSRELALPILLALAAPVVSGFSNVWMKRRMSSVPPSINLWGQTLVGGLMLLSVSVLFERDAPARWSASAIGSIAYLAVMGTVLTFLLLFWLIPRIPMSAIASIPLIDTLLALSLGTVIGGESITWNLAAGAALILVGAGIATRPERPTTPRGASQLPA